MPAMRMPGAEVARSSMATPGPNPISRTPLVLSKPEQLDAEGRRLPVHPRHAAAERIINSHEKITLSARDWEVFYDALVNPPEPNERLKEAARRYRESGGV
jgi:hypothetical protein